MHSCIHTHNWTSRRIYTKQKQTKNKPGNMVPAECHLFTVVIVCLIWTLWHYPESQECIIFCIASLESKQKDEVKKHGFCKCLLLLYHCKLKKKCKTNYHKSVAICDWWKYQYIFVQIDSIKNSRTTNEWRVSLLILIKRTPCLTCSKHYVEITH